MVLVIDCDVPLPTMVGDLTQLRQVVTNIVSNSLKFTESGRVTLSAKRRGADGMLVLAVADTGPGVPPEHRDRMFSKFEQLDSHRSQGTGIGLVSALQCAGQQRASVCVSAWPTPRQHGFAHDPPPLPPW